MRLFDGVRAALVVAAHPDDEVLGCGGTVARLAAAGAKVTTLILATGALSRAGAGDADVRRLREAAGRAADTLGVSSVEFRDFPDNRMDSVALHDVIVEVEAVVAATRPELVLTHAICDLNVDHRIARAATLTACRPLPGAPVTAVVAFETLSASEWRDPAGPAFRPVIYVDIEAQLERKLAALRHYDAEMRTPPHPRSYAQVSDLARMRGREAGLAAAEAFELVRGVAGAA
jgi:LmbE family N-acetylglucosaminyl deacetylase